MASIFSYRPGDINQQVLLKSSGEIAIYITDFAGAIAQTSVTISSATVTATSSTGVSVTNTWVGTTSISGTQITQFIKAGTGNVGDRVQIQTVANLSNGETPTHFAYINITGSSTYTP